MSSMPRLATASRRFLADDVHQACSFFQQSSLAIFTAALAANTHHVSEHFTLAYANAIAMIALSPPYAP